MWTLQRWIGTPPSFEFSHHVGSTCPRSACHLRPIRCCSRRRAPDFATPLLARASQATGIEFADLTPLFGRASWTSVDQAAGNVSCVCIWTSPDEIVLTVTSSPVAPQLALINLDAAPPDLPVLAMDIAISPAQPPILSVVRYSQVSALLMYSDGTIRSGDGCCDAAVGAVCQNGGCVVNSGFLSCCFILHGHRSILRLCRS
jgi:hypothetical protein